jgi:hypothetical protein
VTRVLRAGGVPALVAAILTLTYWATLAPGVTLWDAGEFLAAIHSLGIPHPPGTPLYVVIGSVWARIFGPLVGFARSVNLLSALATAVGCAVLAAGVTRWTSSRTAGIAAGLAAGTMLSVWRSATETEVYALSFALALLALALADRAGISGRWRDAVLAMYVLALAVPLHLSALVVAPGVVAFAATDRYGHVDVPKAVVLGGAALLAMALGTTLPGLALGSVIVMFVASLTRADVASRVRLRDAAALAAVVLIAATGVVVMYLRAQHDPFVNQGNPATIEGMLGVIGREQYDVPALWPRRAPFWLQIGNLVQYADWQVAFGLDRWVGLSAWRAPFTLLFVALAGAGAAWHRALDHRSFRAFALALTSASLGAVIVLNLRAGPSYGVGVLPPDALHEARERDYFFAIAFALAGAWAGIGAARFGRWLAVKTGIRGVAAAAALALASAPLALNWRASDRSTDGPPTLAEHFARSLLDSAPRDAVLFVAGDNDTYPLWYAQRVEQRRPDVTVVTIPLLPAEWYRAELRRRHRLLFAPGADAWRGVGAAIGAVGVRALELGRPVVVAHSVAPRERDALGRLWIIRGMVNERLSSATAAPPNAVAVHADGEELAVVPRAEARLFVDTVATALVSPVALERADGTEAYVAALMGCPARILAAVRTRQGSVDPRCNLR